jgi:hypothetical protein
MLSVLILLDNLQDTVQRPFSYLGMMIRERSYQQALSWIWQQISGSNYL